MTGVAESCLNAACHILGGELLGEDVHQPKHTTVTYESDHLQEKTIKIDDVQTETHHAPNSSHKQNTSSHNKIAQQACD